MSLSSISIYYRNALVDNDSNLKLFQRIGWDMEWNSMKTIVKTHIDLFDYFSISHAQYESSVQIDILRTYFSHKNRKLSKRGRNDWIQIEFSRSYNCQFHMILFLPKIWHDWNRMFRKKKNLLNQKKIRVEKFRSILPKNIPHFRIYFEIQGHSSLMNLDHFSNETRLETLILTS